MKHPWSPQQFASGARVEGRPQAVIDAASAAAITIKDRDPDLPVILTLGHLSHLAGVPHARVLALTRRQITSPLYRVFQLKKRPGPGARAPGRAHRTICVPNPDLMRLQRWINQNILSTRQAAPHVASFAYYADRGVKAAAARHVSCTWLVKMDVQDFFDSITERRVYKVFRSFGYGALLSYQLARLCTHVLPHHPYTSSGDYSVPGYRGVEGRLPQGAPTSPALANLAVRTLDSRLTHLAGLMGWTYTRYADDLAFSLKRKASRNEARALVAMVKGELRADGLEPHSAKTVIASPGARRLVLGLQVDGPSPRLPRSFKNNLDTHLRALTSLDIGVERHRIARKFASTVGMRRHIAGLVAYAHYVEPAYARLCYEQFNAVSWPA